MNIKEIKSTKVKTISIPLVYPRGYYYYSTIILYTISISIKLNYKGDSLLLGTILVLTAVVLIVTRCNTLGLLVVYSIIRLYTLIKIIRR